VCLLISIISIRMITALVQCFNQSNRINSSLWSRHLTSLPLTKAQRENSIQILCSRSPLGWTELKERDALCKTFHFRDFNEAFGFMSRVAMLAEKVGKNCVNIYNAICYLTYISFISTFLLTNYTLTLHR
jgi:hypothetical protein